MVTTPIWQGASPGFAANAGHVNQFLGTHSASFVLAGATLQSSQTTGVSGQAAFTDSATYYISQTIVTTANQTTIGSLGLQINVIGGSPSLNLVAPLTISLYADLLGEPTGSPLATTSISGQYVYSSSFWVQVPLVVSGLTPLTSYHIVTSLVGNSNHYYAWQRSNQITGAALSTNGTTWVNQSYGMMYQVYDQSGTGAVTFVYDDGGARWLRFTYNTNGSIATITEHTNAQSGSSLDSLATLAYTNGLLTSLG